MVTLILIPPSSPLLVRDLLEGLAGPPSDSKPSLLCDISAEAAGLLMAFSMGRYCGKQVAYEGSRSLPGSDASERGWRAAQQWTSDCRGVAAVALNAGNQSPERFERPDAAPDSIPDDRREEGEIGEGRRLYSIP